MASAAAGSFALLIAGLGGQARGRFLQMLPAGLREETAACLEEPIPAAASLDFVRLVLQQDVDRISGDETDRADGFEEAVTLKAADLVAVVCLRNAAENAAALLPHLPQRLQDETLHKLAAQDWDALTRRLAAEEAGLISAVAAAWPDVADLRASPEFAAEILRQFPSSSAMRRALSAVHRMDSGAATHIQQHLFDVDDLDRLNDRELQTFLRGADDWDLTTALASFPRRLRGRLLRNTSERRARLLAEDEAHLRDTVPEDVEAVRERLLRRARDLYESRHIATYLGSVGAARDEVPPRSAPELESPGRETRRPAVVTEPDRRRFGFRELMGALAVCAVTIPLIVWFSGTPVTRGRGRAHGGGLKVDAAARVPEGGSRASGSGNDLSGARSRSTSEDRTDLPDEGDVLLLSDPGQEPERSTLEPGDELDTTEGNRAVVNLHGDGGQLQVDPGTQVRVGERDQAEDAPPRLTLRVGNVWLFIRNPALEVHTPVLEASGSAGSLVRVRVVLSAATEVSVTRGTAWIVPKASEKRVPVILAPGQWMRVEPGGGVDIRRSGQPDEGGWLGLF